MNLPKIVSMSLFLISSILVGCATPGVTTTYDEFAGGYVSNLHQNILNTPGFGDLYFNVKAVKKGNNTVVTVVGMIDYEADINTALQIRKNKELIVLVDKKKITLQPIADTYLQRSGIGTVAARHTRTMDYKANLKQLQDIASAKSVRVKIYASDVLDGGLTGTFTKKNFSKLKEFLSSIENPEAAMKSQKKSKKKKPNFKSPKR